MKKIGLFGNPNTGKSSVFNRLTGLHQHIGNFPGVTVEKQSGPLQFGGEKALIIDFPGTYSIFPRSKDEQVVYDVLSNPSHPDFPDLAVVVADSSNLERNLLLFSQIYDLGLPIVLVLNMTDLAKRKGIETDIEALHRYFPETRIVRSNARLGFGKNELLEAIFSENIRSITYAAQLIPLDDHVKQSDDTDRRFRTIRKIIADSQTHIPFQEKKKQRPDFLLTHPVLGYLSFLVILFLIFQAVFTIASWPMDLMDEGFSALSAWLTQQLPAGLLTQLLTEGIVPGIGGVLIFIPQIAILFFLLSIMEETGYMARVVFIMDRLMRPFGLNGKSVVPLITSAACAIPGVMSARTIHSRKERLTTILVAPLMSCSARIPVYTLIIALVIPNKTIWGVFSLQAIVLLGLYLLGLIAALVVAWIMQFFFRRDTEQSIFLLELPDYKAPRWANVGIQVWQKVKTFAFDAGKIILTLSILLWALATFGPGDRMQKAEEQARREAPADQQEAAVASARLENSYIGIMGHAVEPVIRPLGYDWKIGIALITSFAAREVFVGSLATIYSTGDSGEETTTLMTKMKNERRSDGTIVYSFATGISLLVFYAFAMQCMATVAVVKRETHSWKWPLIQFAYMGILAYISALIAYQLLK